MNAVVKMAVKVVLAIVALFAVTVLSVSGYLYLKQDPAKLYDAIARADTVVVTKNNNDAKVLYRSGKREDIDAFAASLKVRKRFNFSIPSCRGRLGINFYRGSTLLAAVAWLPNGDIREDKMKTEVGYLPVTDKAALARWLEERNLTGG